MKNCLFIIFLLCFLSSVFAKELKRSVPADARLDSSETTFKTTVTVSDTKKTNIPRNREILFEQTLEEVDWSYGVCDANSTGPYLVADNFYGVEGTITGFAITGLDLANPWAQCDEDPMTFDVNFYEDNGGAMGDLIVTHEVTVYRDTLDYELAGFYLFSWTADLPAPVQMSEGVISFVGTSLGEPTDGWFLWGNSPDGDQVNYSDDGTGWIQNNYPLSDRCFTLYGTATEDGSPEAPDDFVVTPDSGGALTADLSWTNPSLTYDGNPLTDLDEIKIYRNYELVYTNPDPIIGGTESYTDIVPLSGEYSYLLDAINDAGESPAATSGVLWIGEDVPGAVTDLLLQVIDEAFQLTWNNPTEGLHNGPYNMPIIGYHIVRNDGVEFEIAGENTMWTDTPPAGQWSYSVQPYNIVGDGGITISNTPWWPPIFVFNVFIQLDEYPSETSWDLVDSFGELIYSGGSYTQAMGIVEENYPLPEGEYTFTIYDTWGDGICCENGEGFYTLTLNGEVFLESSGEFGESESTTFYAGIPAYGSVEGTVTDAETGSPIAGVLLEIEYLTEITDESGYYLFDEVLTGNHIIYCTAESYESEEEPVFVEEGVTAAVDFELMWDWISPPFPVSDLLVTPGPGADEVTLTWLAPETEENIEHFNVYVNTVLYGTTNSETFLIGNLIDEDEYVFGVSVVYDYTESELVTVDYVHTNTNENVVICINKLNNNTPNPFNPSTVISYTTKEPGNVKLEVFNVKGQKVKTLMNKEINAGSHTALWNGFDEKGNNVVSGVYFYKLETKDYTETKKMILLK